MSTQREWFEKDYYKILGVSPSATQKEITSAYRKLAKKHHPDTSSGSEEHFKEISAAYEVLGNSSKRKEYDEVRSLGPMGGFTRATGTSTDATGGFSFRLDDLGDLFGDFVNRSGRTSRRTSGPQRGDNLEAELHLSFQDAIEGVTTTVNVLGYVGCSRCGGTGAAAGTLPVTCQRCNGRGVLDDNQGLFSLSRLCDDCGGTGRKIQTPCSLCGGSGLVKKSRQVKVRIPPGVLNGQRIRVKGRGNMGKNNAPPGDLYVTVHVQEHKLFKRKGNNLTLTVPITFPEAALGADIQVPTLHDPVTLRIPPGTSSGRVFRVRGKGVASQNSHNGTRGDLLVTVDVIVPSKLSAAERSLVAAVAEIYQKSPREYLQVQ
ncbi:MAG: molecular chaperone DnaJ [Actinobacteria bacterium]|nr:molecular chaperone DnaJ [Actinomycetota bacterium]MCL6104023.1 molecular chaperone DnaJ [Actinomycetota bacterium]